MKKVYGLYLLFFFLQSSAQETHPAFFLAKTIGKLPYLKYSLGDDRLGAAKMNFLDSNIVLKIVDSFGIDYKVQLSKYHSAYIDKQSVLKLTDKNLPPYYLSTSWKVFGDPQFDYVSINLDEKLPYHSQQQINPSRIVVDLYGVTSNTNWITQLRSTKEIKNIWYEQTEDDVLRTIIELKHAQHWGHTIYYDSVGKKLVIRIKHQPPVLDIRKLKIAIDAGHGGENAGAEGLTSHILEKDYTLKFAKELQTTLKAAGVQNILMTRTRDTTLDMPSRLQTLKTFNPDILISLHLNSAGSDTIKGTSTYYRYIGFRPLTSAILTQMLSLGLKEYGNVGNFNFSLSGPTDYPNCLLEIAFLSNKDDEKKILDPRFQKAVARKVYAGIRDWLKSLQ